MGQFPYLPTLMSFVAACSTLACGGRAMSLDSSEQAESGNVPEQQENIQEPAPVAPGAPGGIPLDSSAQLTALCGEGSCSEGELCVFGRCVDNAANCRLNEVDCSRETPSCEIGQVPSVVDGCSGPCVDVAGGGYMGACAICAAAGTLCLGWDDDNETFYGCADPVEVADTCDSCDCLPVGSCGALTCIAVSGGIVECAEEGTPPSTPIDPSAKNRCQKAESSGA